MEDRSVEVQAVAILFFVLCWAAVVLRVYCRAWLLRSLGVDDSLIIVSLIVFTGYLICILLALKYGAGKHRDDVDPDNYSAALKLIYASELLYVFTVCVVKISVGFFLLRISARTAHVYTIRALMVLTFLYGTAYFFILAFQCLPVSAFWAKSPRVEGKCLNHGLMLGLTYGASCVNAVADWAFGVLPFFIVWTLSLPLRTRALAVGILRVPSSLCTPSLLSEPGTRPDSLVIPPHWKRDTLHKPAAAGGGGLQPVESNEHEQPREPSLDGGHDGAWMQESQQLQPLPLQLPLTTASSGVWGAQPAPLQHQPPHTPRHSRQMRYSTADEDCIDGNDSGDDDGDSNGDGDACSEASEAPRLNWATPRVSAISFGGWGGGPRSDGRNSMAVADLRNMSPLRPEKSNTSQRSGHSGRSGGGGEEVGGAASNDGMGRSGSFGNFRPRRMADYAAPVPNLPLRYLRKSRRERNAAAADQGDEEEDDPAEELSEAAAAAAAEAMPQPVAEMSGTAQEKARNTSGNSKADASGSVMASRIPIKKKS
ncbi:integral membrane protein [Magnaporthiopsis poae ATCC 64411]|uniref:Integral membrane protein n=1 Tax=Magnaporthiopsis poae (strain ATCC 64411 / 73-15) TaxID=644358 RepID=A0A0C4DWF0_MAGP6|nr:integral membrane protein [Magnaporthiopsis poae ATCC 64411]